MFDYLRDPDEIYRQSFATLRAEADFSALPSGLVPIAERVIHACGMPEALNQLAWGGDPAMAGREALKAGASILVDAEMVGAGIMKNRLPADNQVVCTLNDPRTPDLAKAMHTTRSAAALDLWDDHLAGAVVVFGNAPTALFRLLERLAGGAPTPALILGFPVGFVGAAESKDALIEHASGTPFVTMKGRLGGSAMAAAALNALLIEAPR
ncbi:MAG: precorrin-8X methylmutase [Rhodospirillaceae bacterium]|jgi:precorrin-8X/cobalt-precorrin-8 methylmutase|nr:precorrin-8X methylmutase [Rhodospirillaceae bacterium]